MDSKFQESIPELKVIQKAPKYVTFPEIQKSESVLVQECTVFTRHLVNQNPTSYIISKYRDAHLVGAERIMETSGNFDQFLLKLARKHPKVTRLVDAYTVVFYKSSVVRKKSILLLAILESCAPTFTHFDAPDRGGQIVVMLKVMLQTVIYCIYLLIATVLLSPIRLGLAVNGRLTSGGE
jgi:hypothetical protein